MRVFYGWWIVLAAFLNLFFSVGIIYYGFPVFYPSMVSSLGFTRAQLTQGFLAGFVGAGLLFGLLAGILIDSLGSRQVIRIGIWCVGLPLILMGSMTHLWHYYVLCIAEVMRSRNFWVIVTGCTFTIGAIGAVTQHLILFLTGEGYSLSGASRVASGLLVSSLAGRVIVGYFADRYSRKNVMALFYLALALAIPLLFAAPRHGVVWGFAIVFGFAMGAYYMVIPLVTADCFGLPALGKLLAVIITIYSVGQWFAPWLAGRIFDTRHSYDLAWVMMAATAAAGAALIYAVSPERQAVLRGAGNPASQRD